MRMKQTENFDHRYCILLGRNVLGKGVAWKLGA